MLKQHIASASAGSCNCRTAANRKQAYTWTPVFAVAHSAAQDYTDAAVQEDFLSHVNSSNLADLLRIAINGVECFRYNRAEDCVDVLLAADQTRLHLLHPSDDSWWQ